MIKARKKPLFSVLLIIIIAVVGGFLIWQFQLKEKATDSSEKNSSDIRSKKGFSYQKIDAEGFSVEVKKEMERFLEVTKRLPDSYVTLYANPVEEIYDAMIGIGWDTKTFVEEEAKITTVLDYLNTNVKGFKVLWAGSDYSQTDAGTPMVNKHKAKSTTYTYLTQTGNLSRVKLISWFCESSQRYYNIIFTSPEGVWDKYIPIFEHTETTMQCHV